MKFCQPSSSQSKTTHTRSSSLGSRKTCAPLDPYCLRFSAPLVENAFQKRSKSSIFVVARIMSLLLCRKCRGTWLAEYRAPHLLVLIQTCRGRRVAKDRPGRDPATPL